MLTTIRHDQDTLPDDLDWEAEISAVVTNTAGYSEAEDLITSGQTDTYHHRILGVFMAALQISDPQAQADRSLSAQGRLHAATESPRG